jgi:hypothetical protein
MMQLVPAKSNEPVRLFLSAVFFSASQQYFSLAINQPKVILAMTFKTDEVKPFSW